MLFRSGVLVGGVCKCDVGFEGSECQTVTTPLVEETKTVPTTAYSFEVSTPGASEAAVLVEFPAGALTTSANIKVQVYESATEPTPTVPNTDPAVTNVVKVMGQIIKFTPDIQFQTPVTIKLKISNDDGNTQVYYQTSTGDWEKPTSGGQTVISVNGVLYAQALTTHFSNWAPMSVTRTGTGAGGEDDDDSSSSTFMGLPVAGGVVVLVLIIVGAIAGIAFFIRWKKAGKKDISMSKEYAQTATGETQAV